MSKYKAGLHKDVSAIFNGVSLPKSDTTQRSSADPAPGHQGNSAPKPSVPEPPPQKLPVLQPPVRKASVSQLPTAQLPTQKPPASSNVAPTKPKTQPPPPQSQSKEAPAKQPKADAAAKTAGQAQWQRKLEQIKSRLFTPQEGGSATKQKVMVIAMPVLFIVLIFVFIRVFSAPSQKITGPGKAGKANVAAVSSDHKVDWHPPKPYPTTLRDPMQFGPARGGQDGGAGGLVVKGIVYSEDNPIAVIGDQVIHQGDKISDVVVTKINKNSVEFEANGKKWMQNVQR